MQAINARIENVCMCVRTRASIAMSMAEEGIAYAGAGGTGGTVI